MAIPQPVLDDLTWADLTAAARQRIPAASNGRWTLHAPVDPGVTLVELHAWLLEQRLYWMDKTPDSLTRGALMLLGESARDAGCATTVLHFLADGSRSVAAGTAMEVQRSDPPLVFVTEDPVTLLPLATVDDRRFLRRPRIDVMIKGTNRASDLFAGREFCVLGSPGDEVGITLWLTSRFVAGDDQPALSILLLLNTAGRDVAAQWSADAVSGIAPPASLSWWYASGPDGQRARFPAADVADGTQGLRRSGIVRLVLPKDWRHGQEDEQHLYPYTIWFRADSGGFSAPPRLAGIWPNVASAAHRRSVCRRRDLDWLPLPGNVIRLAPDEQPLLPSDTRMRLMERDGKAHWWSATADLAFHGREDRVFVADRVTGQLLFGNGETGRIPLPGSRFGLRDLIDAGELAASWKHGGDPVSSFIVLSLLSPPAAAAISGYEPNIKVARPLFRALLEGLNCALSADQLFADDKFAEIQLRDVTRAALKPIPDGRGRSRYEQERVNRLLLEDAYPKLLRRGAAELHFRIGGGARGNLSALLVWEPVGGVSAPLAVNPVPSAGGAEPEALADARQRAAQDLRRVDRAVIPADFEELAVTTPGVAIKRAHAAIGWHPDFPCLPVPGAVTVFIVPAVPRNGDESDCTATPAPVPDAGAIATVAARLDKARLIGTEVFVLPPLYRPVALSVDVEARSPAHGNLQSLLAVQFALFLDPLTGGENKTGWSFGEKLRPSVLLRQAQVAIGTQGNVRRVGIRLLDSGTGEESCNDVHIGRHSLPALKSVVSRVFPAPAATAGGLM